MKELSKYIVEKLDLNKVNISSENIIYFPENSTYKTALDFLKSTFFKIISWSTEKYLHTTFKEKKDYINKQKNKVILVDKTKQYPYIFIADTSKKEISEDNPIYHVFYHTMVKNSYYKEVDTSEQYELSEEEFVEELNKHFIWE